MQAFRVTRQRIITQKYGVFAENSAQAALMAYHGDPWKNHTEEIIVTVGPEPTNEPWDSDLLLTAIGDNNG